jgi:hypothetical protein
MLGASVAVGGCGGSTATPTGAPAAASNPPSTVTAAPSGSAPGEWFVFRPGDGAFEIQLPGNPTEQVKQIGSGSTAIAYTSEMVVRPGGLYGVMVAWADYPATALASLLPENMLAAYQASDLSTVTGATLTGQGQISLGGHPGRFWNLSYQTGTIQARAYVSGSRLYLLKVIAAIGDDPAVAARFFGSFTILAAP